MRADEIDEKVLKEFVTRFGYAPRRMRDTGSFVRSLHEFVHFLVSNHYYSDALGKKVVALSLDVDVLSLRAERLRLEHNKFFREVEAAVVAKKKPAVDGGVFKKFVADLDAVEAEARELNAKATELTKDIKKDYLQKIA
ncbi:MAG: hypothetical protein NTY90_03605 [Candidatus Micrarchaeota archaeon]|nr:hypothetical protein [Candidatus Micrarchaeota archaeon]